MNKIVSVIFVIFSIFVIRNEPVTAVEYNNNSALDGVEHAKIYFDVNIGKPHLLLTRLELINTTRDQLEAAQIGNTIVIGVRGKASNFFTIGLGYVLDADLQVKKQIAERILALTQDGVIVEQCRIAAGFQEIEVTDFLPQMQIVANGYVSMIGYQSKGFVFVPMD